MNDIDKAIEELQELKKYANVLKSPDTCFVKMNGMHTELSLVLSAFNLVEVAGAAISALQAQAERRWIPVTERLPKNEERVWICADRKRYDGKIMQIRTTAMYEDGTVHVNNSGFMWEDMDFEYDEEADDYIIPEGWWEQNVYSDEFGAVDDFVTHWQPLPEPPKEDNK